MKQAVVRLAGKQYLLHEGDTITVDHLSAYKEGDTFDVEEVLAVIDGKESVIGTPTVKTKVNVAVVAHLRDKKVLVEKFKSKKRYHKTMGHRQQMTKVKITKIT